MVADTHMNTLDGIFYPFVVASATMRIPIRGIKKWTPKILVQKNPTQLNHNDTRKTSQNPRLLEGRIDLEKQGFRTHLGATLRRRDGEDYGKRHRKRHGKRHGNRRAKSRVAKNTALHQILRSSLYRLLAETGSPQSPAGTPTDNSRARVKPSYRGILGNFLWSESSASARKLFLVANWAMSYGLRPFRNSPRPMTIK